MSYDQTIKEFAEHKYHPVLDNPDYYFEPLLCFVCDKEILFYPATDYSPAECEYYEEIDGEPYCESCFEKVKEKTKKNMINIFSQYIWKEGIPC